MRHTREHTVLELRITPRLGTASGARCAVAVRAVSGHDHGQVDVVRAVVSVP